MLEHIPAWMGRIFTNVRAGHERLAIVRAGLQGTAPMIPLSSPAFAAGGRLPIRFTADGEGVSPPLVWGEVPAGTASIALIVEDPDAPTPNPLVHGLLWDLPGDLRQVDEGEIAEGKEATVGSVGRNSYLAQAWLPPDPPTGHGEHDYIFQLFALARAIDLGPGPGRSDIVKAMDGQVLGVGVLVGTYSRGDPALVGHVGPGLARG
ncbi:YbhB/YbcL family Raf kinase inhibitor-like protein [Sphingobium fuliginis]|jgi:Raf kinase inhibitor-like YbhB/YbcL family protein|uniref:YbhB/YbcL family Raf kinase inhibitor-like protein n=1 Tax=Sphingobium fuliginis (strain ATCC 27551) TaxID=336203 RepID=A0A7M2GMQ7_SPHSA|nr:YbhB/YbcL family Raf kinase inhibitor-like protein [Sphingobium fuliginis]QOT74031.1 YbhB/YbcL family Raf kinase inhibitor-like protein [Sphingobium fuliginis]